MVKRRRSYKGRGDYGASDEMRQRHLQMRINQTNPLYARGSDNSKKQYGLSWALATPEQKQNRLSDGFKGRGDYKSFLAAGSRAAGGWLGRYAGNFVGAGDMGSSFGTNLGARFSKWAGWGRYKRKNYRGRGDYGGAAGGNQIMGGSVDTPITVNASDDLSGDIFLSHREFLGNVTTSGTATNQSPFTITEYPINVGLTTSFPWLSQIAQNFTMYDLIGCIYEFKPTSGELGATGSNALGKVVMATQYDPDAPAFTSTVQMENYDYSNACKPSECMIHGVETAPSQRATQMLYVRTGPSVKDKTFTDIGVFQIATEGLPLSNGITANIGELWVTYRVRLSRAQLHGSLLGLNCSQDTLVGARGSSATIFGDTAAHVTTNLPTSFNQPERLTFGAAKKTNTIGCFIQSGSTNAFILGFPVNIVSGVYLILVESRTAAAGALPMNPPTALTNLKLVKSEGFMDGGNVTVSELDGAQLTDTLGHGKYLVRVSAPGSLQGLITFNFGAAVPINAVITVNVMEVSAAILDAVQL